MSGITAIPLVTLIATVLSVDTHHARIDAGLVKRSRPDGAAVIYYMEEIGAERKKVIVNRGLVIEIDDHSSVLKVDAEFSVLPGYSVELEVPMDRVSPASVPEIARARLIAHRSSDLLDDLIDVMMPEDDFIERQVVRVIENRWRRRGSQEFSSRPNFPKGGAAGEQESEVVAGMAALVRDWAQAWSDQRADDYFDYYSRGFLTPGGVGREAWEAGRRRRIEAPRFIKLSLEFLESEFIDASRGWIRFRQSYWSNSFNDSVIKKLELIHEGGEWKILQESVSG